MTSMTILATVAKIVRIHGLNKYNCHIESMETAEKAKQALEALSQELPRDLETDIMTIAEQLKLEGKLEGIETTLKAVDLFKQGLSIEVVALQTGMSSDLLRRLQKNIIH